MTRIYVGPDTLPELVDAVQAGGGTVVDRPEDAEAIVWWGSEPQRLAELAHDGIRWVQIPSAGIETWIEAGVLRPGRSYTNSSGSYGRTVAEHALALMLAGIHQLHVLARRQSWSSVTAGALFDKTVGIVGAGGIGRELITLLEPFSTRNLAVNRSGRPVPGADLVVTPDRLGEVLRESDFVVIAAPATSATRHLIGRRELGLMRDSAWLVNIARGSLIDTDALVDALRTGEIAGAALDVTDPEPLPDGHPLWTEPRALITPHSANPWPLLLARLTERVQENVRRFVAGEDLVGVIDLDHEY